MSSPPNSLQASMHAPKPSSAARPPSLGQLAARINLGSGGNTPSSSPARPRLAASLLRTGSQTSLSTTASTNDSMAVNAPSTRSVSPALTATTAATPPKSTTPSIPEDAPLVCSEPLTQENLKELNQETKSEKKVKGYKNIPSLDAITAHLAKARSLSIDGSARPPEAELVEDPKTPGATMKAPEHPLQFTWTVYHDTKSKAPFTAKAAAEEGGTSFLSAPPETEDYEAGLTVIGEFNTVESFCRYFNWLKPPSKLERNSNYHIFKSGIKPMWEDPANSKGGKWVLTMKNNPALLDRCWTWLAMALVGEELEEGDEICGAVVSLRSKVDRIQVWTRSKDDVERLNGIGKKLIKLLDVSEADNIGLEFQYNTDDRPLPNKFLSIQSAPASSFRSSFGVAAHGHKGSLGSVTSPTSSDIGSPATAAAAAFGSFGMSIVGGTPSGWRPKRP
ncbi:translation initiation factor eIF 4e-like domain-containing protein [Suillus paluster]|uniref:translation initiation factor eIF 4e-like domain-containing protein n=1 Tax=Suillus paluster TaxID=48578 RepID=UPI001B882BC0|nr:translation initiation factor eIF 4e-like domain-containing protein [Suillus paluster]KAG1731111.1 translation initiation factor eIF 4e-like domain-containing protein [Suillus paluster]